ncbi:MAG TPA: efflux RND transporter periplasmic adaptor subunit, partial [Verrucomicrobiae bacterium]|nr:efflux RND transporter periplasmic adaptor subunit [Verrucomicrobiae bacterium]
KKRRKLIVFSGLALVVGGLSIAAFLKNQGPTIPVQTERAARRNITEIVVANGKIEPVTQVKISPEVSGEILKLPFKEGQAVKKGDLLVYIRPDNYAAARNSALANYKYSIAQSNSAAANLERSMLEYQRNKALYESKLISDSDFLTAKNAYDVAKATLEGASEQVGVAYASLQNSEADLSKTKIFSPLDGTVTKLSSLVGERVVGTAMMAGTDIMTVSDLNEMEARVDIGEVDVVLIKVGQKVRLEVDAFKDRKFEGVVSEIADTANNDTTGSTGAANASASTSQEATKFQVKIRVKEKEVFLPGMSVTAEIETRSHTNVVTVPIQSVTTRVPKENSTNNIAGKTNGVQLASAKNASAVSSTNESYSAERRKPDEPPKPIEVVFVVEGDHVKMVPVKRGIYDDNYVEIVEGLKEGEEVVTGPYKALNRDLADGTKILANVATLATKAN